MDENTSMLLDVSSELGQPKSNELAGEVRPAGNGSDRGDSHWPMHQLRSAIEELIAALSSTLNDERDSAEDSLVRAAAALHIAGPAPALPIQATKGGLAPWQIRKITSQIEANLDMPIKSGDLASIARLSPCHFSRVFRESFGCSPHGYISRRRVEHAQGLMLSGDAPLSQIALDCGFADQAHFSRTFRRIAGESPRTWRRVRVSHGASYSH